jgi:hypothetical protein
MAITESEFERALDDAILKRLRRDPAYVHAEDAEAQTLAEEQIEQDEFERLCARHGLDPNARSSPTTSTPTAHDRTTAARPLPRVRHRARANRPGRPNDFGELCAACLAAHPTRAARRRRTARDHLWHPRQTLAQGSDRYYTAVETFRSLPLDDPRPSQLALF